MNHKAVKIEELSFSYNSSLILNEINIDVPKGCFFGILGPNGSGKSTLLKNITRFLNAETGSVLLLNKDLQKMKACEIARLIGTVPQRPSLEMALTVKEMVLMGRLPHLKNRWHGYREEDNRIVLHILRELGILSFSDRNIRTLSGGELQKVLLARALSQIPEILLLDEATSNLDLNHAIEIMDMVKQMTLNKNTTVISVMHDLNLAARFCDYMVLIKSGIVKYAGTPNEIFKKEIIQSIYGLDVYIGRDDEGCPFVLPRSKICIENKKKKDLYVLPAV